VRAATILHTLLAIEDVAVDGVEWAEDPGRDAQMLLVSVRPVERARNRCPHCGARCPGYDTPAGPRRWRHLDMGVSRCYLEAVTPRVRCATHGVVTAAVPWARHDARMTTVFEDTGAWLAARMTLSAVAVFLQITWAAIAAIIARIAATAQGSDSRLDGLARIGIDEIAYRKGHRYLTVIIDHDTGKLVWAKEGRTKATLEAFFDDLGPERSAALTHVSADGAEWIHTVVAERAPQAVRCLDPFHLIMWCGKAVDKVRRRTIGTLGDTGHRRHVMWAVRKKPGDLSPGQRGALAALETENHELYLAYLMKEQLREVISTGGDDGAKLLAGWISWARDSGIPEMAHLAGTVIRYRPLILNTLHQGVSNARAEATNTHLRAITKRSYGLHSPGALIGLAMLTRGGYCPPLPNRTH
jgi:transposase